MGFFHRHHHHKRPKSPAEPALPEYQPRSFPEADDISPERRRKGHRHLVYRLLKKLVYMAGMLLLFLVFMAIVFILFYLFTRILVHSLSI